MKTIEINNKHYQEVDVILLTTDKASKIFTSDGELFSYQKLQQGDVTYSNVINKHLYLLSDEEIKDDKTKLNTTDYYYVKNHYNEWYIGKYNGSSFDFINHQGNFDSNLFTCKKVIATSDNYLKWSNDKYIQIIDFHFCQYPQIPDYFIKFFIDSFNSGKWNNIYTGLVEAEEDFGRWITPTGMFGIGYYAFPNRYKIKLNDNNEVTTLIQ